jgi:hypothetical protein
MVSADAATEKASCSDPFHRPPFDAEAARNLSSSEVRKRWPRSSGTCPTCGFYGAVYASFEHYIAGDW